MWKTAFKNFTFSILECFVPDETLLTWQSSFVISLTNKQRNHSLKFWKDSGKLSAMGRLKVHRLQCYLKETTQEILFAYFETSWTLPPANWYLCKANNINSKLRYEICSKLTIKTPERHWCRSDVFNIIKISQLFHKCLEMYYGK